MKKAVSSFSFTGPKKVHITSASLTVTDSEHNQYLIPVEFDKKLNGERYDYKVTITLPWDEVEVVKSKK